MNLNDLISDLEEVKEYDLFTDDQIKDINSVLRVLRAHQVLSEGKESGAEHKLERVVAKLKKEQSDLHTSRSEYEQGYQTGIGKAISVIKGEMTDE